MNERLGLKWARHTVSLIQSPVRWTLVTRLSMQTTWYLFFFIISLEESGARLRNILIVWLNGFSNGDWKWTRKNAVILFFQIKAIFELYLSGGQIPYHPIPVFLGITFDEKLSFIRHFENLLSRALKRLNIIKIFSHKSWHINSQTLINIYRALIGSIFDYSFFAVACVSESGLGLIQSIQNRAIRCIFKLKWDSPTKDLYPVSGVLFLRERFLQLGARYVSKSIYN